MANIEKNKETINKFLEAGLHFGHQSNKWNPKNKRFIFGEKNGIHIIDVSQTAEYLQKALDFIKEASTKGDILFVGTKKQAQDIIKQLARESGMPYVIFRWPGGLLTNFNNIKQRIRKIEDHLQSFSQGIENRTKKELVLMKRELKKLDRLYGGVRVLEKKPAAMFVIDSKYEINAVREANKLGIPVVSLHDTNADPDLINYVIPGNDDAIRSIKLICDYVGEAVVKRAGMPNEIDFSDIDREIQDMTKKVADKSKVKSVVDVEDHKVVRVKSTDIQGDKSEAVPVASVEEKKVPVVAKAKPVATKKETEPKSHTTSEKTAKPRASKPAVSSTRKTTPKTSK